MTEKCSECWQIEYPTKPGIIFHQHVKLLNTHNFAKEQNFGSFSKYLCSKFLFGKIHQFQVLSRTLNLKLRQGLRYFSLASKYHSNQIDKSFTQRDHVTNSVWTCIIVIRIIFCEVCLSLEYFIKTVKTFGKGQSHRLINLNYFECTFVW